MPGLMFVIFFMVIVAAIIYSFIAKHKRQQALAELSFRLGLDYDPGKDRLMDNRLSFLNKLRNGSNRYAFNILNGKYRDHSISVFDYHYQINNGKNTSHYFFSFFVLELERFFPELIITKEGIFSKIAQGLGFDDIDFESHEFSRKFCVRSKDKKFAYDVCNGKMINFLLRNTDLSIEIENNILSMYFNKRLNAEGIEYNLDRLIEIRKLLPDYLFAKSMEAVQ